MNKCDICHKHLAHRRYVGAGISRGIKRWICYKCQRELRNDIEMHMLGMTTEERTNEVIKIIRGEDYWQ